MLKHFFSLIMITLFILSATGCGNFYYGKGTALIKNKQYDEAIIALSKSIKFDPGNKKAYSQRGLAYFSRAMLYQKQNKIDEAIKDYDAAISDAEKSDVASNIIADLHSQKAACYVYKKDFDNVMKEIELSLAKHENALAYILRGSLYFSQGMTDKAKQDFTKAYRLDPKLTDEYTKKILKQ